MNTYQVELGERSYPIHIGPGMLTRGELLAPFVEGRKALIVTNSLVGPLYLETLQDTLDGLGVEHTYITLDDGEAHKTLSAVASIIDALVEQRCARDDILIALGGGVTGDIAGFAAAAYQRGIQWIQIPTTLLAQVDSSVGGKTGVNHTAGKNLIGAFHQPVCVLADLETLLTLDDRNYHAGLAEVIKYGLIVDSAFFAWLEQNLPALMGRNEAALGIAIERSCAIKAAIVGRDEQERGERALLNFGHTFGHAIEASVGYGHWLHGEAVAAGMVMAAAMSVQMGLLTTEAFGRISALISAAGLPLTPPPVGAQTLLGHMQLDKKTQRGQIRLVLLREIGHAFVSADFPSEALQGTLAVADG